MANVPEAIPLWCRNKVIGEEKNYGQRKGGLVKVEKTEIAPDITWWKPTDIDVSDVHERT